MVGQGVGGGAESAYARELRAYADTVLREWQGAPTWQPGSQLRAVSYMSARDYAGRFLLELLQNGHDAHPGDRTDGHVHVLLDEREGPYGTLYVANAGEPFAWRQVDRVCKLARSDKRVGDGIGNKGLGFRSVLEITESPEIYSDRPGAPDPGQLAGYRFRFAVKDDLRVLLRDEALAEKADKEFPPLQLPFPVAELPVTCAELGAAGHVTVVRLPLRNEAARQQAVRRLKELARARTPVMLFLDRLSRLVLEHRKADGTVDRVDLVRQEKPSGLVRTQAADAGAPSAPVVSVSRVNLGALGEFLVARGVVPDRRLRDTLRHAVAAENLDETWLDWREAAVVEVALPAGGEADRRGQLYTFLPLGDDVAAPLRGHVNAPFYTKMDRTALDREHPLNAMLFDALAETCLLAAEEWRTLPGAEHRSAAVDVLAWETGAQFAGLLATAAQRVYDRAFEDVPLVPVLSPGTADAWTTPADAVLWPGGELTTLTADAAGQVGVAVADPGVGGGRLRRLARVCASLKCPLEPSAPDRAQYVERIVAALPPPASGEPVGPWDGVYTDLAQLFADDARVLRGRKLLLADDSTVGRCNTSAWRAPAKPGQKARREAFFQPSRGEAGGKDELAVPEALRKRLFSLHPGLTWQEKGSPRRAEAKLFLEHNGLVRRFDVDGLLEHVRSALAGSNARKLRVQALRFVFRLYRSRRPGQFLDVEGLGLYVPSATGGPMIRASGAAFGAGWHGTHGDDLTAVVAEGRDASGGLLWMEGLLVTPSPEFIGRKDSLDDWRDFLRALGVTDGLIPCLSKGAETRTDGQLLRTYWLVRLAKPPQAVREQWEPFIDRGHSEAQYPQTPYVGTPAYRLPGQEVAGSLSEPGRHAYARLVLHGLSHWDSRKFTSLWTRDRAGFKDPQEVLTPLAAFVREQAWIPVRGRERGTAFARPRDAWHYSGAPEEEPAFAQTVARGFRGLLEAGDVLVRLREYGLPTWDDPRDSARLIAFLGRVAGSGAAGPEDRPALQRANQRAWKDLAVLARARVLPRAVTEPLADASLLVESGEELDTVGIEALGEGDQTLYVTGDRDTLPARLIRETGNPLLVVPGAAREATRLLRDLSSGTVRLVDEAELSVEVDGGEAELPGLGQPLRAALPWLPVAIGVLADHTTGGIRPTDTALTELVATARRVRLHGYATLSITLDALPITMPEHLAGFLPLPDSRQPLILAPRAAVRELDWDAVGRLADATAHVVGRPEFAIRLRLAAHVLRTAYADTVAPPERALAEALEVSGTQFEDTVQRLDGALAGVLERCLPVLVHVLGEARARELADSPPSDTREFAALLAAHASELPLTPEQLIAAARGARDAGELRAAAGIDFAGFNRTLAGLGEPYKPDSRAEAHEESVREYVDLHRPRLLDRLRWAALARFDRREPVHGWPELRSLAWIKAPDAWSLTKEHADGAALRAHVEEALTHRLGHTAPTRGERLPGTEQVRSRNGALVRDVAADAVTLMKAAGRTPPKAYAAPDPAWEITSLLDAAGALDFRDLTADDVVAWLAALGQWPAGMPPALDAGAHGLTRQDLDRVRRGAEKAREERARRQRVISIGATEFDIASGDYTELVGELLRTLAADPGIVRGRKGFTQLEALGARGAGAPGPPGSPGSPRQGRYAHADRGLSAAQRQAIGFVGEWFAYQWLREHHPATNETSWVSTNRQSVFPGSPGDNSLGYDFRVGSGKHPLLFEVKATQGEGGQIELGDSEVRAAQRYAGSDRWRILSVTSVHDPAKLRVHVLPNPYSARGRGVYREEGGALRFSYRM
ncbi:DUF3883 domain-containing protein [Streptomyces sp. NPDC045456]|uniref:sacsin N-terminal ATP-binding-like domain-containing protein n=1 Tax=Streptomyces sp. NPDC045456 TaxID=3155254 RepID=UPI0033ED2849